MTDGKDESEIPGVASAADLAALTATSDVPAEIGNQGNRKLPEAAKRALAEAEERRKNTETARQAQTEIGGRGGLDPARFGDWEIKGRAIDF